MRVGTDALQPLKRFILDKTEGNPFFMEEIVQTLREQGVFSSDAGARRATPLPSDLRLPTTVQGVLAARMDRLPAEEKAMLQTLAVIGREFSSSLVRKVVRQAEADFHRVLARLQAAEFVYDQLAFPEVEYIFKHALTQEVAYNFVLQERRKELHEWVAQAIEALWPDQAEDRCSELAYHYRRSGNLSKAITYLHRAGQQALRRSAYPEAIDTMREALALLATQPDSPEGARQELALRLTLSLTLRMAHGLSAEMERAYARAQALCDGSARRPNSSLSCVDYTQSFSSRETSTGCRRWRNAWCRSPGTRTMGRFWLRPIPSSVLPHMHAESSCRPAAI